MRESKFVAALVARSKAMFNTKPEKEYIVTYLKEDGTTGNRAISMETPEEVIVEFKQQLPFARILFINEIKL